MIRSSNDVTEVQNALVMFHRELPHVTKDAQNPHFKNTFASLVANIEAADKQAADKGLCLVQLMGYDRDLGHDVLTTRICHTSGQWMESDQRLHLPKDDPQGQGSAMTYGRRYNYQGAFGLAAEDDDGEAASKVGSAAGGTTHSPAPQSSGRNNVGLIKMIAKGLGMSSAELKSFVDATVGRDTTSLDELDELEEETVLRMIRAKERAQKGA